MPPPDTAVRHRRGYRHLNPEDDENQPEHVPEGRTVEADEDNHNFAERDEEQEAVRHDGWYSLSWSFFASGLLTVSFFQVGALYLHLKVYLAAYFLLLPSDVRNPIVRELSRSRMVMVLFS